MKKILLFLLLLIDVSSNIVKLLIKYNNETGFSTIPISFGSNKEIFYVQIDTSTCKSWIPSPKFPFDVKKYNISQSSTGILTKRSLELEDEDGTVFGKACYDTIRIGYLELKHFGFGLMNEVDYKFNDYPQGKLGLGYSQQSENDFNLIKHLKKIGLLEKEEFMIGKDSNSLFIGNISKKLENLRHSECYILETNTLHRIYRESWSCLLTSIFFGISYLIINGYYVNSASYINLLEVNGWAIFDSSFKYIGFPKAYYNVFVKYFFNGYENTCKIFKDLDWKYFKCYDKSFVDIAQIFFIINNKVYPIFSNDLFKEKGNGEYELLIRFYKKDDNVFTFGHPFMKGFSVAYDYEEKKISFYGGIALTYDEIIQAKQNQLYGYYSEQSFLTLIEVVLIAYIFFLIC